MNTARFIGSHERDAVMAMFDHDLRLVDEPISPEELPEWIDNLLAGVEEGYRKVAMVFDEDQEPVAMTVGTGYAGIAGWFKGISKIRKPNNHYAITARIMAPAEDLIYEYMEDQGYYKYWSATFEGKYHTLRNNILAKYSRYISRYDGFDEISVPPGCRTPHRLFDLNRRVHPWSDILIRMYVLRQEYRVPLVLQRRQAIDSIPVAQH